MESLAEAKGRWDVESLGFQQQQPESQHLRTDSLLRQSNHIWLKLYFAAVIHRMLFSTADLFVLSAQ